MTGASRKTIQLIVLLLFGLLPLTQLLASDDKKAATAAYPGYMALEKPLIVNLANPRKARYLKFSLQFFIETQPEADLITQHLPRLRDRMISMLGGRDGEQLMSAESREQLRRELLDQLRETMMELTGRPAISVIYFTDFIVQ